MNAVVFPPSAVLAPVATLLALMNAHVTLVLQEMEKCATVRRSETDFCSKRRYLILLLFHYYI